MHVLVFSGTTEGCMLVQQLDKYHDMRITVCSATEYGSSLVPKSARIRSISGQLDQAGMEQLIRNEQVDFVVDATHPFAEEVTKNIAHATQATGVKWMRLLRASADIGIDTDNAEIQTETAEAAKTAEAAGAESTKKIASGTNTLANVANATQAAKMLRERTGNVLLTTGSKELSIFTTALPDFQTRLYVRVLPLASSVEHARELGIPLEHVIAMKGPFSQTMNEAFIREFTIRVLVTKESGKAGGFAEKINAARTCGVDVVVIRRPVEADGASLEEVLCAIERATGKCRSGKDGAPCE